jgi:Amidohydrolase ring-opening protein (Amido_AtzD_TrzD)
MRSYAITRSAIGCRFNYERDARAAVGAVIASITSDPTIFVWGSNEHQCGPAEGAPSVLRSRSLIPFWSKKPEGKRGKPPL